jgi:hypothetical protein
MRIPFPRRKPLTLWEEIARATYIPSREAAMPRLRDTRTYEEIRAAGARSRRIRANGGSPS